MANQITNYKCPACTAPLHFVGASGKLECDYCGSSFTLPEIEKLMAEEEAKAQAAFKEAEKKTAERKTVEEDSDRAESSASEEWGKGMKAYSCPSCGAELVCEETTVATSCPYCGNPSIVPGQFSGMLKPDCIIPFKLDEEAAKAGLKKHYKGKPLLPKNFAAENRINEIKGVYVPFWMYDGETEGRAEFDATKSGRVYRRGEYEITETDHYRLKRSGGIEFRHVPVDASKKMPNEYMDSIEPYDYKELRDFSSAYLPGFLADKYDETAKECECRAEERAKKSTLDALRADVNGYSSCSLRGSEVEVKLKGHQYAMLPVYLLATKWQDTDYLFAMNGQTGKLIGDLPVDKKKFWAYFAGIFVGVLLVLGTLLALTIQDMDPVVGFEAAAVVGLLSSVIVTAYMKSQMKTARAATDAGNYIPEHGIIIREREDRYTHTTRTERRIQTQNSRGKV